MLVTPAGALPKRRRSERRARPRAWRAISCAWRTIASVWRFMSAIIRSKPGEGSERARAQSPANARPRLDGDLRRDVPDIFDVRNRAVGQRYVHDMAVAAGGNGGSGERRCSDASECDRWKLPHENVLQRFRCERRHEIYRAILNRRLIGACKAPIFMAATDFPSSSLSQKGAADRNAIRPAGTA